MLLVSLVNYHICAMMEQVASFSSNASDQGEVPGYMTSNRAKASAASAGPYACSNSRQAEMMLQTGEVPEETRDEPQMISQRWNASVPLRTATCYKRSYRKVMGGTRPIPEGQPYTDLRRYQLHQHWHQQSCGPRWYRRRGPGQGNRFPSYNSLERSQNAAGGMAPISSLEQWTRFPKPRTPSHGSTTSTSSYTKGFSSSQQPNKYSAIGAPSGSRDSLRLPSSHRPSMHSSVVVIPESIAIPNEMTQGRSGSTVIDATTSGSHSDESMIFKRSSDSSESPPRQMKRAKIPSGADLARRFEGRFDKLDLLCSATLELGPLQDNPAGCSCPKSKCIALYCDCFKAGRRCSPNTCTCLTCKNTLAESGPDGARSKAIQSILARNPRAFTNGGSNPVANKPAPGEQACNCIRSRCLKLYCTCFQVGRACNPATCTCIGCLNTEHDTDGHRQAAIEATLEKRPDAFDKPKTKEIGSGCACKNNRCIRKYCECFRTNLACTKKCSCRECENKGTPDSSLKKKDQSGDEPLDSSSITANST